MKTQKQVMDRTLVLLALVMVLSLGVRAQGGPIAWVIGPAMPSARGQAAVATMGGNIYLFGGRGADSSSVVYLNSANNTWVGTQPLDTGRVAPGVGVGLGYTVLVFGGQDGDPVNSAILWDPASDNPISEANLTTERWQLGYATDGAGTDYAIGGQDANGHALATVETMTTALGSWTKAAPLPTALYGLAAVYDGAGHIYAIGGTDGTTVSSTVYRYTVASNAWVAVAPLPVAVTTTSAALGSNGKIYVVGGINTAGVPVNNVQVYNPATNAWAADSPLPSALSGVAVATDTMGRLMAAGGVNVHGFAVTNVYVSQPLDLPDAKPVFTSSPPTSVTEGNLYSYQVAATGNPPAHYSLGSGPAGMTMSTSGLISWTPTLAQAGTKTVSAVALNRAGRTTQTFTIDVLYPPPTVPTGFNVVSEKGDVATLGWSAATTVSPDPVTYNLAERSCSCWRSGCHCVYSTLASGLTSPEASFTGTPGKNYVLAVSATAAGETSAYCSPITVTLATPNPITNLTLKSATSTTLTMTWTPGAPTSDPVVRYDVVNWNSATGSTLLGSTTNSTGMTVTGLTPNTTYWVYVFEYDAYGVVIPGGGVYMTTTK